MGCCCGDTDDDGKYEYDPDFDGIEKDRKCTDIFCCMFFVLFLCGMIAIFAFALMNTNYRYIYIPTDSRGLLCGYDNTKLKVDDAENLPNLEKNPDLFWVRFGEVGYARSFCVEECPKKGYFFNAFNSQIGNEWINGYSKDDEEYATVCGTWTSDGSDVTVIVNDDDDSAKVLETPQTIVPDILNYWNTTEGDKYFCPYASEVIMNYCFPVSAAFQSDEEIVEHAGNISAVTEVASVVAKCTQDLYELWWAIAACVFGALFLSLVWLLLLRCMACVMVWITILIIAAALACLSYLCYLQWHDKWGNHDTVEAYTLGFVDTELNQDIFEVLFWVLIVIDAIYLLLMIFMFSRIVLSIKIISLTAKVFGKIPAMFFFPIFIYVLMFIWWVFIVAGFAFLFGAGTLTREEVVESSGTIDKIVMTYDITLQAMAIVWAVGWIWVTCFLSALGEMTVAGVIAQWYFMSRQDRKSLLCCSCMIFRSFGRALRYHTGTLAVGSFIITVCKIIRALIEYIDHKTKNSVGNFAKCCIKCMKCCFWCFEKFLKYLNRNVYILTAIHGYSFCPGCCKAFNLILRNILRVGTLNAVGDFTLFLGKVCISVAVTAISIYLFPMIEPNIQTVVIPGAIVFICSWLAAGAFTGVFEIGIDSMFMCFLEDEERNEGREKYAPRSLTKYVNKHEEKMRGAERGAEEY